MFSFSSGVGILYPAPLLLPRQSEAMRGAYHLGMYPPWQKLLRLSNTFKFIQYAKKCIAGKWRKDMMNRKLSMLAFGATMLLMVSACGAEARQPDEPAPPPEVMQTEAVKPEPDPEPLEDIAPMEGSGPVVEVEPTSEAEPEAEPEEIYTFDDCNEIVYATDTVNLRSGPSTDYEKVGSLKSGDSVVRTGIGIDQFENWSRIQLADGSEVYVNNNYISTTKPVVQQSTKASGGSSTAAKPSSQSSGASSGTTSSGGTSGGAWGGDVAPPGQGLAGILDYDGGVPFEEGVFEESESELARVNMG